MSPAEFAKSNPSPKCHAAWCGQGPFTFLQFELDGAYFVAQIWTKGCILGHYVASFYLNYSVDGIAWENYTRGGVRQVKIFFMHGCLYAIVTSVVFCFVCWFFLFPVYFTRLLVKYNSSMDESLKHNFSLSTTTRISTAINKSGTYFPLFYPLAASTFKSGFRIT